MNKAPFIDATVPRQSLLLGLLALLLFIAGNWNQAIIGFDSRFVLFAQEMLRHGPSFFPTTYGQPYADYLATSTLLTWLFSLPLGQVTSLTAWLPTAIASALIVILVYRLTAPYSPRWGLLSVAMLLLSSVVYFLPPYVITPEQIDFLAEVASEGIDIATRSDISVAVPSNFHPDFRDPG